MAAFASPEWIDDLAHAATSTNADPNVSLTVEQRISGPGATVWHFHFEGGSVRVLPGPGDDPTITLTSSLDTATAIHAGELSAQRAFLDGALQIGGDLHALIANRVALGEVAMLLATRA